MWARPAAAGVVGVKQTRPCQCLSVFRDGLGWVEILRWIWGEHYGGCYPQLERPLVKANRSSSEPQLSSPSLSEIWSWLR